MGILVFKSGLAWLFLGLMLQACGGQPVVVASSQQSELIAESLSGVAVLGRKYRPGELPNDDILAIDTGMEEFAARHASRSLPRAVRAGNLLRALLSPGVHGLSYEENQTLTATSAFKKRQANCLAFSNLYVAMAREAGLKAYFQDVLVAPQWELNDGSMTLRRHVNVRVRIGRRYDQVIDLSRSRGNLIPLKAAPLSDRQAFAQYYNNRSMDYLYERDYEAAFLHARKALLLDSRASFIWSNLGVILSRVNKLQHAEAALVRALQLNPDEHAAMVNLSTIFRSDGREQLALDYEERVRRHRASNPYYLLMSARKAFDDGRFNVALVQLRKALELKRDEALFYELKARSHQQLGQHSEAIKALQKAVNLADTVRQRDEYGGRLNDWKKFSQNRS